MVFAVADAADMAAIASSGELEAQQSPDCRERVLVGEVGVGRALVKTGSQLSAEEKGFGGWRARAIRKGSERSKDGAGGNASGRLKLRRGLAA